MDRDQDVSAQEILDRVRLEKDLRKKSEILYVALSSDPEQEGVEMLLRDLGDIHRQLGEFDTALFYLEQAWAIQPNSWEIMVSLGAVYTEKGEHDQALQLYSKAYEIKGKPHVLALCADALHSLGRDKEAEVYARTSIRLQDNAFYGNYVLGKVLCTLEQYDEALKAFKIANKTRSLKTVPQWITYARDRQRKSKYSS